MGAIKPSIAAIQRPIAMGEDKIKRITIATFINNSSIRAIIREAHPCVFYIACFNALQQDRIESATR